MKRGSQRARRRIGEDKKMSEKEEGEGGFKENREVLNYQRHGLVILHVWCHT